MRELDGDYSVGCRSIENPPTYAEAIRTPSVLPVFPPSYSSVVTSDDSLFSFVRNYNRDIFSPYFSDDYFFSSPSVDVVQIGGWCFYDVMSIFCSIFYYIPIYLFGPVVYMSILDHISIVCGNSKRDILICGFVDFLGVTGCIFLSLFIILCTSLFLIGKFSYSWFLSSRIRIESNLSIGMTILLLIINTCIIKVSYDAWIRVFIPVRIDGIGQMMNSTTRLIGNSGQSINSSAGQSAGLSCLLFYVYLMLVIVYFLVGFSLIRNIRMYYRRWDCVYYRNRYSILREYSVGVIKTGIVILFFVSVLSLLGCLFLFYYGISEVIFRFGNLNSFCFFSLK